MEGKGKVCVTGASGYVGSWLVMKLLQHGYSVNATVRSNKDLWFITDLPGASERLEIFEADLVRPDTFRAAVEGCVGVFLVAHQMSGSDEKTSVASTLAILQACLDAKTVKRAVYISSAAAAIFSDKNTTTIDEDCWSDINVVRRTAPHVAPYAAAKTSTEKAALEFAEKHGLELVTLLPTYIHGPFIVPRCPASVYTLMSSMFFGNADPYKYLPASVDLVHVDDVASALIFLMERRNTNGRYICSAVGTTVEKVYQLLCSRYPEYRVAPPPPPPPPRSSGETGGGRSYEISSKKLTEAGFEYKYGLEEMYDGALECCDKLGLL